MRFFILSISLIIWLDLTSQIKIDQAGDNWSLKIDSALMLIKESSLDHHILVLENCKQISFFNSRYSSNSGKYKEKGTIFISSGDIEFGIQNLAMVIVHESLHLMYTRKAIIISPEEEELSCYYFELQLLNKFKNPDPFLRSHCLSMIDRFWYIIKNN
jgi:hypothetical protein